MVGHQGIGAGVVVGPDVMERARECDDGAVEKKRKAGLRFLFVAASKFLSSSVADVSVHTEQTIGVDHSRHP